MPITRNLNYRIRRSERYSQYYAKLKSLRCFKDYAGVLMYSALFGFINSKSSDDGGWVGSGAGILMQFFSDIDKDIWDCLAYDKSKGKQSIITDEEGKEKFRVFEEYANAGFPIMLRKLGIEDTNPNVEFTKLEEERIANTLYSILLNEDFYDEDSISTGK